MRRYFWGFVCLVALILAGCSNVFDDRNINQVILEPPLPKDIKAISAQWADDRLFYLTKTGVYAFYPADRTTKELLTADLSKKELNRAEFSLSPDHSKYILVTYSLYGTSLEIRDAAKDKSILVLDVDRFRKGHGLLREAGWVDNDHIYLSTIFRLFVIDINSGEEVQVSEEWPESISTSRNDRYSYLSGGYNVIKLDNCNELYYTSVRDPERLDYPIIYEGDESGERIILPNAETLIPVNEKSFVFRRKSEEGNYSTYLYNVDTKNTLLLTDKYLAPVNGIFKTNNGKLSFVTGESTGGIYEGVIFDPATSNFKYYDIYNHERDYSYEKTKIQFGYFTGAFQKDDQYIFLFSIEEFSQSKERYITRCLAYNTKKQKLIEFGDYEEKGFIDMELDSSGNYIVVKKYNKITNDYFLFDIKETVELLATSK